MAATSLPSPTTFPTIPRRANLSRLDEQLSVRSVALEQWLPIETAGVKDIQRWAPSQDVHGIKRYYGLPSSTLYTTDWTRAGSSDDEVCYFEASIHVLKRTGTAGTYFPGVGVGLLAGDDSARASSAYTILWYANDATSSRPPRDARGHLTASDTFGCGLRPKDGAIFFTKNGAFKGEAAVELGLRSSAQPLLRPVLEVLDIVEGVPPHLLVRMNFGQDPFKFKVARYLERVHSGNWQGLTSRSLKFKQAYLPEELLSMIVNLATEDSLAEQPSVDIKDILPRAHAYCAALSKLAMVCHGWSKVCRSSLFTVVHIRQKVDFLRLSNIILHSPPMLAPDSFVKTLWVSTRSDVSKQPTREETVSLELVLISPLVKRFRSLKKLVWDSTSGYHVPPRVQVALPALLRTLTSLNTLRIGQVSLGSFGELLNIIRAITSLVCLELDRTNWPDLGQIRWPHTAFSSLTQLNIRRCILHPLYLNFLLRLLLTGRLDPSPLEYTTSKRLALDALTASCVVQVTEELMRSYFSNHLSEQRNDIAFQAVLTAHDQTHTSLDITLREYWHLSSTTQENTVLSLTITFTHPSEASSTMVSLHDLNVTFGDYFKPIPAPEGQSFQGMIGRLDDLISSLPKDPGACKAVIRSGEHYRPWLPHLKQSLPRLMPHLYEQGIVQVDDARH